MPILYFQHKDYPGDNFDRCMPTCPDSECHRMRTRFERRQWDHNRSLPIPFSLDKVDRFWEERVWGTPKTYQVQLAPDALSKFAQWMTTATTGNTYMLELEYLVGAKNVTTIAMKQHMRYTIGTKGSRSLGISFVSLKHFRCGERRKTEPTLWLWQPTRDLETFLRSHGYPDADIGIKAQTTYAVNLFLERWAQLDAKRNITRVVVGGHSQWSHNAIQLAHQSKLITHIYMIGPSSLTAALEAVKSECSETVEALVLPGRHDNFVMTRVQQDNPQTWPSTRFL